MKESFTKRLRCCTNPEEFPKLAKEMGFSFHLRRGRVNWHKIDAIDIDRLIQERDLATLQENLISIINYSLDAEYDVKILDPSFVKLFKLAQLSIDYLMYSEQHVYNCVQLAQEEILKLFSEVQRLRKECKKKDLEQKNLKKRMRYLERLHPMDSQQLYIGQATTDTGPHFQCKLCGKVFQTAVFLQLHHGRRHASQPFTAGEAGTSQETERLQLEVKELKERLNLAERLLQQEREQPANLEKDTHVSEQDDRKNWEEENKRRMDEWQQNEQKRYREELARLQEMFLSEIQRVQELTGANVASSELAENLQKQEEKLSLLQEELGRKLSPSVQDLQSQLSAQEQLWRSRLSDLEQQHRKDLQQLASRLSCAEAENAKVISTYESKIQSLTSHMKEQDLMLHSQGEQIKSLTSLPHVTAAPRQVVQSVVRHTDPMQSAVHLGSENDGNRTPVKPFLNNQTSGSSESPSPPPASIPSTITVVPVKKKSLSRKQQVVQLESVYSSRDSGLDSPKRAPPHSTEDVGNLGTEHRVMEQEQLAESDGSDESTPEEVSESSESDSQLEEAWDVAVPSLQEAIALNPNILTELKGDLKAILERRLQELGVDPEWEGIPKATFKQKMSTVKHHQNITAKRYKNFFTIKESLKKEVDNKVAAHSKDMTSAASRRSTGLNFRSRSLTKMMGNVRHKALGILQGSSKHKPSKGRSAVLARTVKSISSSTLEQNKKRPQQMSSISRMSTSPLEGKIKDTQDRERTLQHQLAPSQEEKTAPTTRSDDFTPGVKILTSTPLKAQPATKSSISSTVLKSAEQEKSKYSPPSSSVDDESELSDIGSPDRKTVKWAGTSLPVQHPVASADSLAKKRVIFSGIMPATEVKSATSSPHTTVAPANATKVTVEKQPKEASPTMSSKQKAVRFVKFSDEIRPQLAKDVNSDSDWGISSGEDFKGAVKSDSHVHADSSHTIRLSTKQSDKIAQISKNIEHQLNLTRKKPVGGVEAMFSAGDSGSLTTAAGREKNAVTPALNTSLSDWDLKDFDEFSSS